MFSSEKSGLVQKARGLLQTNALCTVPVTCPISVGAQPGHLLVHSVPNLIVIDHYLITRHVAEYRNTKINNSKKTLALK